MTPTSENNGKRRDRHDIVEEILKTATEGKIKTHIMYKAKLSYAQLNEYIGLLVEKGFLEPCDVRYKKQDKTMYKTTPRGTQLLKNYNTVKKMWRELYPETDGITPHPNIPR